MILTELAPIIRVTWQRLENVMGQQLKIDGDCMHAYVTVLMCIVDAVTLDFVTQNQVLLRKKDSRETIPTRSTSIRRLIPSRDDKLWDFLQMDRVIKGQSHQAKHDMGRTPLLKHKLTLKYVVV